MNKQRNSYLLAAVALALPACLPTGALAVQIANDTFDVGAATVNDDPGDPNDLQWNPVNSSNLSVANFAAFTTQAMKNQGGTSYRGQTGELPFASLNLVDVGDSISVNLQFTTNNATGLNNNPQADGYRLGLFNSAGEGYFVNLGVGGTAELSWNKDTSTGNNPADSTGNSQLAALGSNPPSETDNNDRPWEIVLTKTASGVQLDTDFDGSTLSHEDTTSPITSFDNIWVGTGNHSIDFWIDDVTVDVEGVVVPEPSTTAIAALGLLGLALFFHRRRQSAFRSIGK